MGSDKFEKYMTERYDDQRRWIDRKAVGLKKTYTCYQTWVIILASVTTVFSAVGGLTGTIGVVGSWAATVISALVTVFSSILATFKHKETWLNYRVAAEALKREKYFYQLEVGDYSGAQDKEKLFVQRVEAILAMENAEWVGVQRLKDEAEQPKTPAKQ